MHSGVRRFFINGHPFALILLIFIITSSNAFAAPPEFIISGSIQTNGGTGVGGVNIAGDNGAGSGVTAADGSYSIAVPNHWSGTITASKAGWVITPASKSYNRVSADIPGENYIAYQPKISGYAKTSSGVGLAGANVSTNDGASATTDVSGYYELFVPYDWSGTVIASLAGYNFTARNLTNVTADQSNQDFAGYQPKISGYVKKTNGTPLSGVSIFASGASSAATNTSGYYEIVVPYEWTGTLSASLDGYDFASKNFSNVTADQANQDFTGYQPKISGYVKKADGTALSGAAITADNGGGNATTNAAGYYEITVPYGWGGIVRANLGGYSFNAIAYVKVISDQVNQDYTGFQPTISGYTNSKSGVTITASGVGSVVSNASYFYSITVPYGWSGTASATLSGYNFAESPRVYNNIAGDLTNQNFTAFQPKISGYVKKADGTALSGATVTASGGGSTTTNESGYYEIFVPYGWSGTLTASLANYGFTAKSYTNVTTDQINQDFTGFQPTISGTITSYSAALEGVTLTATNGGGTVSTNSAGNYNLIVPYGWSGTITPSKPEYTFTPAKKIYANVTADTASQNYTAVLPPVSISGYVRDSNGIGVVNVYVVADDNSVTTDSSGYYSINRPYGWSGTVRASKLKWQITPANYSYSNLTTNQTDQNFAAILVGIIVRPDGTGDYPNIQAAISAAVNGDTIKLERGTYSGTGNRDVDFLGKAITVKGATGEPNDCIINCQGSKTIPHRGFKFVRGENAASVLEAVTIINGYGFKDIRLSGSTIWEYAGGAIYCNNNSNPTIRNCIISNNSADLGGGICNQSSSPIISRCVISNNMAGYDSGGGIFNYFNSNPIISNCIIKNNTADWGAGIHNLDSSNAIIKNCIISGNSANYGGGICNDDDSRATILNCTIVNNSATYYGGIFNNSSIPTVYSCILWGNSFAQMYNSGIVRYCDVQGGYSGIGNIDADPLFAADYHLSPDSGCINAGDPNYVPGPNERDIDGDLRSVCRIDMGADEVFVENSAAVSLSKTEFVFQALGSESTVNPQILTISNIGALASNWHIENDCNWLIVAPSAGQTESVQTSEVILNVDLNTIGYGTYFCQFEVIDPCSVNSRQTVEVTLNVLRPQIGLNKANYSFTAYGKNYVVAAQNLAISNTGYDTLNWQIQVPSDCNWLSVTPQSGQAPGDSNVVILSVDPSRASYGTNTCQFTVVADDASNSPQTVDVSLHVFGPTLVVDPPSVTVYAEKDGGIIEKTFTVINQGYDTMNWSVDAVTDCNWITAITPSSGQCQKNEISTVAVSVNPTGLKNGFYNKTLTIRSPEYASPRMINLDLQVYTPNEIHVPADYNTIQEAINASMPGGIIVVHPGKYAGFDTRSAYLTIQSIEPENPAVVAATIVESAANIGTSSSRPIIDGLSFIYNPVQGTNSPAAGIYINWNAAIIRNCVIKNFPQAGILVSSASKFEPTKIINCVIANNGSAFINTRAGIYVSGYDTEIRNCLIVNNYAGGVSVYQGRSLSSKTDIINCTVADNGSNYVTPLMPAFGLTIDGVSTVSIKNSILWNKTSNLPGLPPIAQISISPSTSPVNLDIDYSTIKDGRVGISAPNTVNIVWGQGNIESDPCFAKAGILNDNNTPDYKDDYWISGDYHLKSHFGRWQPSEFVNMDASGNGMMDMTGFAVLASEWQTISKPVLIPGSSYYYHPYLRADLDRNGIVDYNDLMFFCGNYADYYDYGQWVYDDVNSPCVDAGDLNSEWKQELWPHGKRVNMGAYGNTVQASMSSHRAGNSADLNNEGIVNLIDYAQCINGIDKASYPSAEDINRDGLIDLNDLWQLCQNWLWAE